MHTSRKTGLEEDTTNDLIQSDPLSMIGEPVVAGTRIPVELILEKLADGETIDQLLGAHPRLSKEGILAAVSFAATAPRADSTLRRTGISLRFSGRRRLLSSFVNPCTRIGGKRRSVH